MPTHIFPHSLIYKYAHENARSTFHSTLPTPPTPSPIKTPHPAKDFLSGVCLCVVFYVPILFPSSPLHLPSLSLAPPSPPCWGKSPLTRGKSSLFERGRGILLLSDLPPQWQKYLLPSRPLSGCRHLSPIGARVRSASGEGLGVGLPLRNATIGCGGARCPWGCCR